MAQFFVLLVCLGTVAVVSAQLCNLVSNPAVSAITTSQAALTWSNSGSCTPAPGSYEIDLRNKVNGVPQWANTSTAGPTSYTITGLSAGIAYTVTVLPHTGSNKGAEDAYARSVVVKFSTPSSK